MAIRSSRVIHLVPWFGRGGRERVVIDIAQGLMGRRESLVGLGGGSGTPDLRERGIEWIDLPLFPSTLSNACRSYIALRRAIRRYDIGLIHSHHRYSGMVGRIASSLAIPFVSTVHDLASGHRIATRFSLGRVVMVFSRAVEQHLVSHFGLPRDWVYRVPMGCRTAERPSDPTSVASVGRTERGTDSPRVGFFGRLEWEKGPDLFLRAGVQIVRECPDAELWLAGVGNLEPETQTLAKNLGLGNRVRFLGWRADIEAVMRSVDVVVVPSRREGFGRTVLEAMILGKPVVASRVGGLGELIEDGENGCLVGAEDPSAIAEATLALLRDPDRARRLGMAARERTRNRFSLDAMTQAVEHVYQLATARARESATPSA